MNEFFESSLKELSLDEMELVAGGKKRPFVRSLAKDVNVRSGPGTEYPVVAQLGYLHEVAVISKKIVKNGNYYWAKVVVGISQSKFVEGWVSSKYCEGCWS